MSNRRREQVMPFADAMDIVADIDNDLPDGAFFALAHEVAGLKDGEGFDELERAPSLKPHRCPSCKKRFTTPDAMKQHVAAKHGR